jgi:DNA-binding transcriptional ArsR family regulator
MITLDMLMQDVEATRLSYSPLVEVAVSYHALTAYRRIVPPNPQQARWLQEAERALQDVELPFLHSLASNVGYIPDFLTPTPIGTPRTLEEELTALVTTSEVDVRRHLQYLLDKYPEVQNEVTQHYQMYPHEAIYCLIDEVRLYWDRVLAPHWSQIKGVLEGDILYRARQLATGGAVAVYQDLGPTISLTELMPIQALALESVAAQPALLQPATMHVSNLRDGLEIVQLRIEKNHDHHHDITGRGMQLVPTAFPCKNAWWQVDEAYAPMLNYPARGIGHWKQETSPALQSLELLVGPARASVLVALDIPATTSELARQLHITAGGISQHLDRLQQAGLVEPHRSGRSVYYQLTERGQALLNLFDVSI